MTLQISLIGIAIASVFYFVAFLALYKWGRSLLSPRLLWPALIPASIVVLLVPWLDEFWIAWHFSEACKDAGIHVYRRVEADGFVDDTSRTTRAQTRLGNWNFDAKLLEGWDSAGYRFRDRMLVDGGVVHLERTADGVVASIVDQPIARYLYRFSDPREAAPVGYRMWKYEYEIVDRKTYEVLGRDTSYHRAPGFVEGLWIGLLGSGQSICRGDAPHPPKERRLLYDYVFIKTRIR